MFKTYQKQSIHIHIPTKHFIMRFKGLANDNMDIQDPLEGDFQTGTYNM